MDCYNERALHNSPLSIRSSLRGSKADEAIQLKQKIGFSGLLRAARNDELCKGLNEDYHITLRIFDNGDLTRTVNQNWNEFLLPQVKLLVEEINRG